MFDIEGSGTVTTNTGEVLRGADAKTNLDLHKH